MKVHGLSDDGFVLMLGPRFTATLRRAFGRPQKSRQRCFFDRVSLLTLSG